MKNNPHNRLKKISELENNWNNNGAKPFSKQLINTCKEIVDALPESPFIAPTAADSIQMEYEKENGDYLELNVFENKIETFQIIDGKEEEYIKNEIRINEIRNMVAEFLNRASL